ESIDLHFRLLHALVPSTSSNTRYRSLILSRLKPILSFSLGNSGALFDRFFAQLVATRSRDPAFSEIEKWATKIPSPELIPALGALIYSIIDTPRLVELKPVLLAYYADLIFASSKLVDLNMHRSGFGKFAATVTTQEFFSGVLF